MDHNICTYASHVSLVESWARFLYGTVHRKRNVYVIFLRAGAKRASDHR